MIDKPAGLTSHQVVARLRRLLGTRKIGHAGTLDPMATGVLLCGVGAGTRLLGHLALTDKAYDATIRLGRTTVTDDAEGEVTATVDTSGVTAAAIRDGVAALTGDLEQVPSAVSAIKVGGVRSYARVRAGEVVELTARPVTISAFTVRRLTRIPDDSGELVDLEVSVECSTGTYVRALARDLGAALGVGGHLTALRRTRVGPYSLAEAVPLPDTTGDAPSPVPLVALGDVARRAFAVVEVDAAQAAGLRHGRPIPPPGRPTTRGEPAVHAALYDDELLALVRPDGRPFVVLAAAGSR